MIALNLINQERRLTEAVLKTGSCDTSYTLPGKARFRVNIFSQRGNYSIVLRKLKTKIPTLEELGLPKALYQIAKEKNGIVLVTGATGSRQVHHAWPPCSTRSTTRAVHIITLEDPVEFVHPHKKSTFNQRELGMDFDTSPTACAPRCARRPRSSWWAKCATAKRSRSP